MRGVGTRHSANALLSFGWWSSSAKGRHHERPDRDGRHGPPSGDRLAWRSLGRGPRLRAMTHTRGRHVPLGATTKSAPARRWPHRPGNIQTRKVPNTDADSRIFSVSLRYHAMKPRCSSSTLRPRSTSTAPPAICAGFCQRAPNTRPIYRPQRRTRRSPR